MSKRVILTDAEVPKKKVESVAGKSRRTIITDGEILRMICPKCHAPEMMPCRRKDRTPLAFELESTELAFHHERIMLAFGEQLRVRFADVLTATDKALILYYAYTMVCDAVEANSEKMFGKLMKSVDVQAFFAQQAITELRKDKLIDTPKPNAIQ